MTRTPQELAVFFDCIVTFGKSGGFTLFDKNVPVEYNGTWYEGKVIKTLGPDVWFGLIDISLTNGMDTKDAIWYPLA